MLLSAHRTLVFVDLGKENDDLVIAGNSVLAKMIVRSKKRIQQALEISLLHLDKLVI